MALNFAQKDIVQVALGHELSPNVTMEEIVNQIERGIVAILKDSNESKVYLCGHSAGAHLVALTILYTDFKSKYNIDINDKVKGLVLASGIFDLTPLIATTINDNLNLKFDECKMLLSPIFLTNCYLNDENKSNIQIILAVGEQDSPAFKEQSQNYLKHLKNDLNIKNVNYIEIEKVDHFLLVENLCNDHFPLTQVS
jgi:arylformamidase